MADWHADEGAASVSPAPAPHAGDGSRKAGAEDAREHSQLRCFMARPVTDVLPISERAARRELFTSIGHCWSTPSAQRAHRSSKPSIILDRGRGVRHPPRATSPHGGASCATETTCRPPLSSEIKLSATRHRGRAGPSRAYPPDPNRSTLSTAISVAGWGRRWGQRVKSPKMQMISMMVGGEGGIRTPGALARTPHFECGAIDHSATSPGRAFQGASASRIRSARQLT